MNRDTEGRFKKGCKPGPGRPKRETEKAYMLALGEECPVSAWREIVSKAVEDAKNGDVQARAWLGRYLLVDSAGDIPSLGLCADVEEDVASGIPATGAFRL